MIVFLSAFIFSEEKRAGFLLMRWDELDGDQEGFGQFDALLERSAREAIISGLLVDLAGKFLAALQVVLHFGDCIPELLSLHFLFLSLFWRKWSYRAGFTYPIPKICSKPTQQLEYL